LKIVIIGAGAMGSVFGAKLSEAADTILINTTNSHTDAVIKNGFILLENPEGFKKKIEVKLVTDYKTITDKFDVAIIFTKSYKTKAASYTAKALLKEDGIVLTLQNGIGNFEIISNIIGEDKTTVGVTSHGATLVSPGYVRHAGIGDTYIAEKPNKKELVNNLIKVFEKADITVSISENINSIIWGKLIINAGINAIAGILKVPNGIIGANPESSKIMQNTVAEAVKVADALGINLPFKNPFEQVKKVCIHTANNRASMFQDIIKLKKTEIKFINGAIVNYGEKFKIPTPYNRILTEIIEALEAVYDK